MKCRQCGSDERYIDYSLKMSGILNEEVFGNTHETLDFEEVEIIEVECLGCGTIFKKDDLGSYELNCYKDVVKMSIENGLMD